MLQVAWYFAGKSSPAKPWQQWTGARVGLIKGTNDQAQLEAFIKEFADTPLVEMARAPGGIVQDGRCRTGAEPWSTVERNSSQSISRRPGWYS
jgi:hypothetical protein